LRRASRIGCLKSTIGESARHWIPYVVGPRTSINVTMDWTNCDADSQATIMLSLLTRHGHATLH
jgi:hypothetical protein